MIKRLLIVVLWLGMSFGWAQAQSLRTGSILLLDQASLLSSSKLGQDILALEQSEQIAIFENNDGIIAELEAEEAFLTEQRLILPADEFRMLANQFDEKVEAVRATQIDIDQQQLARVDNRRRAFFQFIVPQLGELIQQYGSAAILDRRSVLLFDKNLDITLETIALLDQAYEANPDMINLGN